ncbi:TPA: hypothetical protein ACGIK9_002880 [Acinetobacter baumannii]|uniref:hypothetical protein n=1 Tax=Acinetobacter baumannii TaxID=470 RepID=UPI00338F85FC
MALRLAHLKAYISNNLIDSIELIEQEDGNFQIKAYGMKTYDNPDLPIGLVLVSDKNTIRTYTSLDRAFKPIKEYGYLGDIVIKQYQPSLHTSDRNVNSEK